MNDLLRRDGHLSDITIDRYLAGDPSVSSPVEQHLVACAPCDARVGAARSVESELPPLRAPMRQPRPPSRFRKLAPAIVVAAAAGIAFFVLRPTTSQTDAEDLTPKGGAVSLQVVLDDGKSGTSLPDGSTVRPGDRVGFAVKAPTDGWLLVLGRDDAGDTYLCYPQDSDGAAARLRATERYQKLDDAIVFDGRPGREHMTALFCPQPFGLELAKRAVAGDLTSGTLTGCSMATITLEKSIQ